MFLRVKNFSLARATKHRLCEKLTDEIFTGENFPNYGSFKNYYTLN